VDHIPCLKAWAESLGGINYPLLSDFWPHGEIAERYGVLRSEGFSERAIFVIDKKGIIQFVDIHDIDDQPSNNELRKILREIDPSAIENEQKKNVKPTQTLPKGGIVIYCTPWCPDCKKATRWLDQKGLDYTLVDITKVPAAAEQVQRWADGNRTTPTFDIDDAIVVDWDEHILIETLKKKGYL